MMFVSMLFSVMAKIAIPGMGVTCDFAVMCVTCKHGPV